jgi:ABC-2 type transport system permease protein
MIAIIARHEAARLFRSPLAWVLLAAQEAVLAWTLLRVLERFAGLAASQRVAGLTQELTLNLFGLAAALLLLAAPLLSLRLFSEELRAGSYPLLASAPVSLPRILLGKLLGLLPLLSLLALMPLLLSLALLPWSPLDIGLLLAATLGLLLAAGLFAAVGLFASSLTHQPAAAGAIGYALLLGLSLVNQGAGYTTPGGLLLNWLAWNEHLLPFLLGLVQTSDLAYFLLLSATFLALTLRRLARLREAP